MNIKNILLSILLIASPLSYADTHQECNVSLSDQQSYQQEDEFDVLTSEFDATELDAPSNIQEPSRLKVMATAAGLALLFKYFEMKEMVADWQESLAEYWHSFLVACHIKNEEKNEDDTQESKA